MPCAAPTTTTQRLLLSQVGHSWNGSSKRSRLSCCTVYQTNTASRMVVLSALQAGSLVVVFAAAAAAFQHYCHRAVKAAGQLSLRRQMRNQDQQKQRHTRFYSMTFTAIFSSQLQNESEYQRQMQAERGARKARTDGGSSSSSRSLRSCVVFW